MFVRLFYERQKQTESEMKGLVILIRLKVAIIRPGMCSIATSRGYPTELGNTRALLESPGLIVLSPQRENRWVNDNDKDKA